LVEHEVGGEFIEFLAGGRPNPDAYWDNESQRDGLRHFSIHFDEVLSLNVASMSCFVRSR